MFKHRVLHTRGFIASSSQCEKLRTRLFQPQLAHASSYISTFPKNKKKNRGCMEIYCCYIEHECIHIFYHLIHIDILYGQLIWQKIFIQRRRGVNCVTQTPKRNHYLRSLLKKISKNSEVETVRVDLWSQSWILWPTSVS